MTAALLKRFELPMQRIVASRELGVERLGRSLDCFGILWRPYVGYIFVMAIAKISKAAVDV